jgi:hypothetical protein
LTGERDTAPFGTVEPEIVDAVRDRLASLLGL